MDKRLEWKDDGVGLGGQYLGQSETSSLYAAVQAYPSFAECSIWTPGCGFSPRKTIHCTVNEAKQHAEAQMALLTA